jgi:hypothetical protein
MDGLFMTGNMRFAVLAIALFFIIIWNDNFTTLYYYMNKQKSADSDV